MYKINDWLHTYSLKGYLHIKRKSRFIFSGNWVGPKTVCLSFDCDYPEDIKACDILLPTLREENVVSSFVIPGFLVKNHPQVIQNILNEHHEVINHTFSHSNNGNFEEQSFHQKEREIANFQNMMKDMFDYDPQGFRAPHCMRLFDRKSFKILKKLGLSYDSSYLGQGVAQVEDILEIPLTPCPEHPQTSFDSYHHFRLPIISSSEIKFLRLWSYLLDHNSLINIFLDPQDVPNKLLQKMFCASKRKKFDIRSLGEVFNLAQNLYKNISLVR